MRLQGCFVYDQRSLMNLTMKGSACGLIGGMDSAWPGNLIDAG